MKSLEIIFFNLPALAGLVVAVILAAMAFGRPAEKTRKLLVIALCVILLLHLVVFLHATLAYVVFPYEGKSVVEGGILYNAMQYMHGEQPYHPPDEIPFRSQVYPPGYELALAGLFALTGPSLYVARLFSLACALGVAAVVGLSVWRQARAPLPAIFAALLVVGLYGATGQWVEQVRNDAMMQFLVALGLYLAWRPASRGRFPISGLIVLLLALFTKQVAVFAPAALAYFLWTRSRRVAISWSVSFAACALVLFIGMQIWSDGWFAFYTLRVPFSAGTDLSKLDLASAFFGSTWLLFWGIVIAALPRRASNAETSQPTNEATLWGIALAVAVVLCVAQSLKWGGALNAFIPLVPPLAVLAGLAFYGLDQRLRESAWMRLLIPVAAIAQLAMISYQPVLPNETDRAAQRRISEWVRAAPGDCFVSVFSSQVFLNGKKYFGDNVTMGDLKRAGVWQGNEIIEKARRGEFALMVLRPKVEPEELAEAVSESYVPVEQIPMRTAMTRWPFMQVYVPKGARWRPADTEGGPR
jgi:hypothetical protein